jgi:hypothetical protein
VEVNIVVCRVCHLYLDPFILILSQFKLIGKRSNISLFRFKLFFLIIKAVTLSINCIFIEVEGSANEASIFREIWIELKVLFLLTNIVAIYKWNDVPISQILNLRL